MSLALRGDSMTVSLIEQKWSFVVFRSKERAVRYLSVKHFLFISDSFFRMGMFRILFLSFPFISLFSSMNLAKQEQFFFHFIFSINRSHCPTYTIRVSALSFLTLDHKRETDRGLTIEGLISFLLFLRFTLSFTNALSHVQLLCIYAETAVHKVIRVYLIC